MPIDQCPHTFQQLATSRLPELMAQMRRSMAQAHPMEIFARTGVGDKSVARELSIPGDFPGCYVLIENDVPLYVGISRGVLKRLRQHVLGKTHFDASLAYRMASHAVGHELTRSEAMQHPVVKAEFDAAQTRLRAMRVAFIEIQNDLEIYLFEAYCAMELETSVWNTFRTH